MEMDRIVPSAQLCSPVAVFPGFGAHGQPTGALFEVLLLVLFSSFEDHLSYQSAKLDTHLRAYGIGLGYPSLSKIGIVSP